MRACLGNQADIYRMQGDFATAWQLVKHAEKIARSLGQVDGLRRALRLEMSVLAGRAAVLRTLGNQSGEQTLRRERERISQECTTSESDAESAPALAHFPGNTANA